MKTLTQHIQESLNNKSVKKIEDKPIEEDLSGIMRTSIVKDSVITRGTLRDKDRKKD